MLVYVHRPVDSTRVSPTILNLLRWVFGQPQTETTVKKFTCHDGSSVELRLTTRIHGDGSEDNQAINYFLCDLQDLASLIDVKFATVRELRAAIDEHPRAHSILASRVAHSLMIQSSKVRTPKDLRNDIKVRLNEGPIAGVAEVKELWGKRWSTALRILNDLVNAGEIDCAKVRDKGSKNGTKTLYFTSYVLKTF